MSVSTRKTRRLARALVVAGALVALVAPAGQAATSQPDAIDRYLANQARSTPPGDAIDRYLANQARPVIGGTEVASGAFGWGDFGIGVAAAFGLMLVTAGLGAGFHAARQGGGRLTGP